MIKPDLSRRLGFVWGYIQNNNILSYIVLDKYLKDIDKYNSFDELPKQLKDAVLKAEKLTNSPYRK